MNIPSDLRYSSDHEWTRVDGGLATVGITDFAQDSLGDVVFVELPETGTAVSAGDALTEVESTKSIGVIYATVSGTVVAANDALADEPSLLNSDPYGAGWICTIEMSDPAELDGLMDADGYRSATEG